MANKEHVNILKKGVRIWNKWRKEHPEVEPDLSTTEAIEFVKPCGKIAENSCDGKIMTPYKNTPLPPWRLDNVQTPFSPSR